MTETPWVETLPGGCCSHHPGGIDVYYDARHRCIRCPAGDGYFELVQEYRKGHDAPIHNQMLLIVRANGTHSLHEYERRP